MNINELNKIKITVLAQPQKDTPRAFLVSDFPSVKQIYYEEKTIQPDNEQEQAKKIKVWSFNLQGKWQPLDNSKEIESDVQCLTITGMDNATANPENSWSLVALAVQEGNGLVMVTPRAVFFQEVKKAKQERTTEQAEEEEKEYKKIVTCYDTDITPITEK